MKNIFKLLKLKIRNFIEHIAKENQKNIGSDKLDCCSLNYHSRKNYLKNYKR